MRFLWYGAGCVCFSDDGAGSCAFHEQCSWLVVGGTGEKFLPRQSSSVLTDVHSCSESLWQGFGKVFGVVHWLGFAEGSSELKLVMRLCNSAGMGIVARI